MRRPPRRDRKLRLKLQQNWCRRPIRSSRTCMVRSARMRLDLPLSAVQAAELRVPPLPEPFASWFTHRGWRPHPHQLALLDAAKQGRDALLIAPTGGGKTLAGFLPSLVDLAQGSAPKPGARVCLHTLYVS